MKTIFNHKKKAITVFMLLSLLFTVSYSNAATITSTASGGNWSTGSTWVGGIAPATGDTVIIATTGVGAVNISGNLTQTAAGSVTVNSGAILTTSNGTITFGAFTINSGGTATIRRTTTILGATNISGTINFSSTVTNARMITFTGDVTLNSGAVWTEPSTGNGANNTYIFGGNFTNNAATFNALGTGLHTFSGATKIINGSTLISIPSITFTGAYTNSGSISCAKTLTVTGVTLTNNGTITSTTALSGTGGLTQGTSGVLNIRGTSAITTLIASAVGNTVNYTGVTTRTIHSNAYYNLTLNGSGTAVLQSGTTSIGGNFTLSGTIATTTVVNLSISGNLSLGTGTKLTTGATFTLGVTGTSSVTGTLTLGGTGAKTFIGDVTLNSGSIWNETGVAVVNYGGNLTNNATTFTANTGTHTFSGATKIVSGTTTIAIPTATFTGAYTNSGKVSSTTLVTVTGVTLTNNGTITASASLTGTGGVVQGTTGVLNLGGAIGITTLNASASGNTVNYIGASQTGYVTTYSNLILSGSATKTFATTPTVNSVLSLEGTASVVVTTGVITYGGTATLQYNKAASYTATTEEWISPFLAIGGIIIKGTGTITTPGNVQIGNNTSVPLNINIGATLALGSNGITFHGDFINEGILAGGLGDITIAGTTATQSIAGFTTTGAVTLTKTAGTATFIANVNGNTFIINGSGGTLNLGIGLIHTFTGEVTLTAGSLNGGSSTLNENSVSTTAWNGIGSLFTPASSTVNFGAAGNQIIVANTVFNNLSFSNSGIKTFSNATAINNNFSISGTAIANLGTSLIHASNSLTLGGTAQAIGVWGSTASIASNKNATWFGSSATGFINVNCLAQSPPTSGGNRTICSSETIPTLTATVSAGQTIDWYTQASGGTLLQSSSTSYMPSIAGTYYAETKNTTTGCLSATRTGVVLIINPIPTLLSLTGSVICTSPGGNGTITSSSSQSGVNYQLYNSSNAAVQSVKAGTGVALSWTGLSAGTGYYVKATNTTSGCFSTTATVDVATNANPIALALTGSLICNSPGDNGTIISSTSESGVNYQLYDLSNAIVQSEQTGTGAGLTWSFLNPGNGYYVKGINSITGCASSNSNAVNVTTTANPVALVLTGGTICASPGDNGIITTSTSVVGVDYQLNDNLDNDIGIPIAGTGTGLSFTGVSIGTGYYVISTNAAGCDSVNSNSVDVGTTSNNTVGAPSSTPTLSVNTALTNITHTSTGAIGIGTATGLPTGVTATWASNTITISGTPTVSGTFNYSVPLTGGCGSVNAAGTITVNTIAPTIGILSIPTKNYGDATFTLTAPTSNSSGAFTYSSSNTSVATISGTTIIIVGAGTSTITATQSANGNYTSGIKTATLTVNKATPTVSVSPTATAITFGQTLTSSTLSVGTASVAGTFAFTTPSTAPNAGTASQGVTFTPTDTANYNTAATTASVTVNKATPTATLTVSNSPVTYTGSDQSATVGISVSSVEGTVSSILTGGLATQTNAGTYLVTASFVPTDSVNYNTLTELSAGNFVISPIAPTLSVTNSPQNYTGSSIAATVSGTGGGVVSNIKFEGSSTAPTNAGTYAITADIAASDNYTAATDASAGTFVISPIAPTLSVTNTPQDYIGSPIAATVSGTGGGVVSNIKFEGSSTAPTNAGTYAITADIAASDNYTGATDASAGTFVISPIALTITADNDSKCFGDEYVLGTTAFTSIGLVSPQTIESVTLTSSGADSGAAVTIYSIVPSSATGETFSASNYAITYTNGVLTVNPTNTVGVASSTPTLCLNTALTEITHTTTGATGIGFATDLPAGVIASWASDTITISGTPTVSGTFNYSIPLTGGCGTVNATGTIIVNGIPDTVASITASDVNLCKYIGTTNTVTYTASPVADAVSYIWTIPAEGVTIKGGQGTNVLEVDFHTASTNSTTLIGYLQVKAINASGCESSVVPASSRKYLLPKVPNRPLYVNLTYNDVQKFRVGNFVGDASKTLVLTATDNSGTASSYHWDLPAGVNVVDGNENSDKVISINLGGVEPGITDLEFSVYADAACGSSLPNILKENRDLPGSPLALALTDNAISTTSKITKVTSYLGTTTPLTLTVTPVTVSGYESTSYKWVLPSSIDIVGASATLVSQSSGFKTYTSTSNLISINLSEAVMNPSLLIKVYGVNGNGESLLSRNLTLTAAVSAAPAALKLTNDAVSTSLAVTNISKYIGTSTPLTLTATASVLATSYEWELPDGVTQLTGGTTNVITIDFAGVSAGTTNLSIGVKAVNSAGSSITRTLALTAAIPAAPAVLKLTNDAVSTSLAVTNISKYIGTTTPLTLTATASVLANSYDWELPSGVTQLTGGTTNVITIDFAGVSAGTTSLYLGAKAVNGVGVSVTNNSALVPSTISTAKLLKVISSVPIVPSVTGQVIGVCGGSTYTYTIIASPLANTYNIITPTGSVVKSSSNMSNETASLETSDLTFTVTNPFGLAATALVPLADKSVTIVAKNGVGSSTTKTLTLSTAMPAITTVTGSLTYGSCSGNQVYTITPVAGATEYVVTLPANAVLVSQSLNVIIVNYSAITTPTSTFKVLAKNACGVSSALKTLTLTLGVCPSARISSNTKEAFTVSTITEVYPNPASSDFNIDITASKAGVASIAIYSLDGAVVSSKAVQLQEGFNKINEDISSLSRGIYFVKLTNSANGEVILKKLIKQ